LVVLALAMGLSLTGGGVAAADSGDGDSRDRPVPYNLTEGVARGALAGSHSNPPGANDFGCSSKAHPHPVVLVHGFALNRSTNWQTIAPLLANNGYCVFSFTYGVRPGTPYPANQIGGSEALKREARELKAFVAKVRTATGADTVDLVGHSLGTIYPQYYLRFLGGAGEVDKFVAISGAPAGAFPYFSPLLAVVRATGQYGTAEYISAESCGFCIDVAKDSTFMRRLNSQPGGPAVPGVEYTTLVTRYDEVVVPYTLGRLPPGSNVTNITTQDGCEVDRSDHGAIIATRRTGQITLNALDPAHARTPPCDPVLLPVQGSQTVPFVPLGLGR
jgi:triacylglycerol lipase